MAEPMDKRGEPGAALSDTGMDYSIWRGGRDISISLNTEMLARLRRDVLEGFHALPRRGAEVGGLLVGSHDEESAGPLRIEAAQPLRCEHRFGPSFVLSEGDRTQLETALDRMREEGLSVAGFYRSCTGREMVLDAADEELIRTYFGDRQYVFLLIKPLPPQDCVGRFFFWKQGESIPVPDDAPVAFRPEQVFSLPPPTPLEKIPEPEPPPPSEPQPRPELPIPEFLHARREGEAPGPQQRSKGTWRGVLAVLLLVLSLAAAHQLYEQTRQSHTEPLENVGLNASQSAAGLEVTWDTSLEAVHEAKRGVLSITDGASENAIELNQAAVQRGRFFYRPAGGSVMLRLSVFGSNAGPASESLKVLALSTAPHPAPQSAPEKAPEPGPEGKTPEPEAPQASAEAAPPPTAAQPAATAAVQTEAPAPAPEPPPPPVRPREVAAEPPVPIHQAQIGIPEGIRARIHSPITVPVTVYVNRSGGVVSAVPQGGGDGLYRYLAERAAAAAKMWRFRPARSKNGTPLPGTTTVQIVFTPESR